MNPSFQIPVYENFTIDIDKYPRKNTPKHETDIILITFLLHQEYLKNVSKSYQDAVTFYNECKEYFYVYKTPDGKKYRKFSAQDIIFLINQTNIFFQQNRDIFQQQKYLRKYSDIEQLYFVWIKNRDFYLNLFLTVQDAKHAFFQRREINYKLVPPFDFYANVKIPSQVYTAIELLEINAYTQFLLRHKIIKELPEPLFLRNYFTLENRMPKKKIEEEKVEKEEEKMEEKDENEEEWGNQEEIKIIHFS